MGKYEPIITCRTIDGERQTTAIVYGAWAAHRSLDAGDSVWAITHVPSGFAVPRAHTMLLSKKQVIEAVRRIDTEMGPKQPKRKSAERLLAIIHGVLTGSAQP